MLKLLITDVFCETNYFTVDEMDKILEAGKKYNLNQKFMSIGLPVLEVYKTL